MHGRTWSVTDARLDPGVGVTRVSYPAGEIDATATVVGVAELVADDGSAALGVVLDATAAHPLSPTWPDQPADRGVLVGAAGEYGMVDVRQGVASGGTLVVDAPRAEGAAVVVHLVPVGTPIGLGDGVRVVVDEPYRRALSLAHSACHLNALALDAALAPYWTKDVTQADSLGHPAFDQLAIQSSTLLPFRAVDVYRLGKSLRKKGFDAAALAPQLSEVQQAHAAHLARWVAADAPLAVDTGDGTLSARRAWRCRLDDADVVIPCGGTHATSTADLRGISATYELSDALDQLVVTTTVPSA